MIQVEDKTKCTGCEACVNACPLGIIEMEEDSEGFRYPRVDKDKCINCGRCDKVCMMYHENEKNSNESKSFAAVARDKSELKKVSSGGVFLSLAKSVIFSGGVVYGVKQTDIVDRVCHDRADTIEEAMRFCRSKYLQSHNERCFNKVKADLERGLKVLYTGTGCQIGGLYLFLEKDYDNLCTCEVICHGVPSSSVFRSYISETSEKNGSNISKIIYRDKSLGWKNNHYAISFDNGKTVHEPSVDNPFHKGYLMGLYYRPSCGQCRFAKLPRVADITLADFWRYEGALNRGENTGISLVVCNNKKGEDLFFDCREYVDFEEVSMEAALNSCRHLSNTPIVNEKRKRFFNVFKKRGFYKALDSVSENKGLKGFLLSSHIYLKNKFKRKII